MTRKLISISALSICTFLSGVGVARASSISISDTFAPASPTLIAGGSANACTGTNGSTDTVSPGNCKSLQWTFQLAGFNSGTDTLSSATATITTHDDDSSDQPESFDITLDLLSFSGQSVSNGLAPTTFQFNVLSQLGDGSLVVKITSQGGNHDFFFDSAVLNASGTRTGDSGLGTTDIAAVPEPATLGLLGFGLAALAARARRVTKR